MNASRVACGTILVMRGYASNEQVVFTLLLVSGNVTVQNLTQEAAVCLLMSNSMTESVITICASVHDFTMLRSHT